MTERLDVLECFARAQIEGWAGLPERLGLSELAEVFRFDPADRRGGWTGDPPLRRYWIPAVTGVFTGGLRLWLAESDVVVVEGIFPVDEHGRDMPAPNIGEPDERLAAALGPLRIEDAESVYAARGLAVRANPEDGSLLGLVGFAPTNPERYRTTLRPLQDPCALEASPR